MDSNKNLFIDISGSVGGFSEYWNKVAKYYNANSSSIHKIYLWDNDIKLSTHNELYSFISNQHEHEFKVQRNSTQDLELIKNLVQLVHYQFKLNSFIWM